MLFHTNVIFPEMLRHIHRVPRGKKPFFSLKYIQIILVLCFELFSIYFNYILDTYGKVR